MANHLTTQQLITAMLTARANWERLLAEVGEARLTEPGGDTFEHYSDHITPVRAWLDRAATR